MKTDLIPPCYDCICFPMCLGKTMNDLLNGCCLIGDYIRCGEDDNHVEKLSRLLRTKELFDNGHESFTNALNGVINELRGYLNISGGHNE